MIIVNMMPRCHEIQSSSAQLRKVLNVMFPPSYIALYHKPPNSVCSLLSTKCWPILSLSQTAASDGDDDDGDDDERSHQQFKREQEHEASTEPSSRASLISLRGNLNSSLVEHQAKPVGLCPIRRAIYDQCFDELIRQVTVGCIEQGLLLFRVRNELRMTLNYYRKAYESGVEFGLNKAIEAEFKLERSRAQIFRLESSREVFNTNSHLRDRMSRVELKNRLESVDKMDKYYKGQLAKKDRVIEQQRAIIRALSLKAVNDIKSPT